MTIINSSTKRGADMIRRASIFEGSSLHEVYSRYSAAKAESFNNCRKMCNDECGSNFRIISHNTFGYSVAWDIFNGVRIETPKNSYFVRNL